MSGIKTFLDLKVWQKSHELTLISYKITQNYPKNELFGLISQSRRSAVSISANIVEGFKRQTIKDSLRFYNISSASLEELKYHILLARDLSYINKNIYQQISKLSDEVGKLLARWIQSQQKFL